jgi:hypothetical protein
VTLLSQTQDEWSHVGWSYELTSQWCFARLMNPLLHLSLTCLLRAPTSFGIESSLTFLRSSAIIDKLLLLHLLLKRLGFADALRINLLMLPRRWG